MIARQDKNRITGVWSLLLAVCVLLPYGCSASEQQPSSQPEQQAQQPAPPAVPVNVSINAIMVDLIDHASHEIWDATGDPKKAPKTEGDWGELEHHATQLSVAGSLIMLGGTGKADVGWIQQIPWKQYSQELSDAGAAARSAVRDRNLEALSKAGDQLVTTCESCHKQFKPESPTEGIAHHHEEYTKPKK
ncbi:MAG TPA: hypothetical protein VFR05_02005 [Terriglobia bacterium]|nr:hypothetical protein [Terriglobia bacterium]